MYEAVDVTPTGTPGRVERESLGGGRVRLRGRLQGLTVEVVLSTSEADGVYLRAVRDDEVLGIELISPTIGLIASTITLR